MRETIKSFTPQPVLNFYSRVKSGLEKRLRYVPPNERIDFDLHSIYEGHFKTTYRGIPTLRFPFDYVMYQMILSEVRPDMVIEIGTNLGGTALYLADLMNALGNGVVHSIDIDNRAVDLVKNHSRIRLFNSGWKDYDIAIARDFHKILVLDDGSHTYEDVAGALEKFSPLVSPNSYFIVEDGIIDELGLSKQYSGGPLKATREFLSVHPEFFVDDTYCNFFGKNATANVSGYLKRLR